MKVSGAAIISMAFSIANIIGPQTFQAKDAPRSVQCVKNERVNINSYLDTFLRRLPW